MVRSWRKAYIRPPRLLLVALMLGIWRPGAATAQTLKSLEVSAGYVYLRDPVSDLNFPAGWMVGAAAGVNRWLAGVFEVAENRRTETTVLGDAKLSIRSYMAGGRVSTRVGRFVEFGHLLGGAVRGTGTVIGISESNTRPGVQLGGGFEFPFHKALAFRGQADFRVIHSSDEAAPPREFFFTAAVAYRFF
jgi:hypothetical protein